jgi:hypothetical protein
VYVLDEFVALHARHEPVRNDENDSDARLGEFLDGFKPALGVGRLLVEKAAVECHFEFPRQREQYDNLVVYAQNRFFAFRGSIFSRPCAAGGFHGIEYCTGWMSLQTGKTAFIPPETAVLDRGF